MSIYLYLSLHSLHYRQSTKMSRSKPKHQHLDRTLKEKIEIHGGRHCGIFPNLTHAGTGVTT